MNLTCLAQSHDNTDITYQWYFRGMGVSTTNQSGVAAVGNMLLVAGGLNGSVQCFARNRAGEVSDAAILSELAQYKRGIEWIEIIRRELIIYTFIGTYIASY